jgi:hypothetical protein
MAEPNTGPALVSMAQQFTGLPMKALIGGPLNAAAEANAMMAVTQTKFMLDTCFIAPKKSKDGTTGENTLTPILVTMQIKRGVIDDNVEKGQPPEITSVTTEFDIPLLTLIPLNSLGVTDVNITFDMEVKSSYTSETSSSTSSSLSEQGSFEAKFGWGPFSVEVKGSVSHDEKSTSSQSASYKKSNSAKYTVDVTAGQLPLPDGVTTIIQAFTNSISPIEVGKATSAS